MEKEEQNLQAAQTIQRWIERESGKLIPGIVRTEPQGDKQDEEAPGRIVLRGKIRKLQKNDRCIAMEEDIALDVVCTSNSGNLFLESLLVNFVTNQQIIGGLIDRRYVSVHHKIKHDAVIELPAKTMKLAKASIINSICGYQKEGFAIMFFLRDEKGLIVGHPIFTNQFTIQSSTRNMESHYPYKKLRKRKGLRKMDLPIGGQYTPIASLRPEPLPVARAPAPAPAPAPSPPPKDPPSDKEVVAIRQWGEEDAAHVLSDERNFLPLNGFSTTMTPTTATTTGTMAVEKHEISLRQEEEENMKFEGLRSLSALASVSEAERPLPVATRMSLAFVTD